MLPCSGGLLDQDSLFIFLASEFEAAHSERAELEQKRATAKAKSHR